MVRCNVNCKLFGESSKIRWGGLEPQPPAGYGAEYKH